MKPEDLEISADEAEQLKKYRDEQPDARLRRRFVALLMLYKNISTDTIQEILGVSYSSLRNWVTQYTRQGVCSLASFSYKPKEPFLSEEQIEELVQWVDETHPGNREQIQQYIQEKFKILYSLSGISRLLKRNQLKKNEAPIDPRESGR